MAKVFSVAELTSLIRQTLESEDLFQNVLIAGELSNFKAHSSGHLYFTLKDERSGIKCVMWRSRATMLRFTPKNGMKLLVKGSIGVYERDGTYQLYATSMEPDGLGSLYMAYEQLKARLQQEGLFDPARKRALPPFPGRIAVVTSPTGAALRDIISVLGRRYPLAQILVVPVLVQGPESAPSIVEGLKGLSLRTDIDAVILGRGGGSIEELWSFNEESVARAIAACPHPVVVAVGHETDITIADFVADLRAPTPSAAAELVSPDARDLKRHCSNLEAKLCRSIVSFTQDLMQEVDELEARLKAQAPQTRLLEQERCLDSIKSRLDTAFKLSLMNKRNHVSLQSKALLALSPVAVLARGYSVTRQQNRVLTDPAQVEVGDEITSRLLRGTLTSVVVRKESSNEV